AAKGDAQKLQAAKDFLHQNPNADFVLQDELCQKKCGALILKPVKAYKEYRQIVQYFAARSLMEFCSVHKIKKLNASAIQKIMAIELYTKWTNAGGQILPSKKVDELCAKINSKKIDSWEAVHKFYDACQESYGDHKARYAIYLLEELYSRKISDFTKEIFQDIIADVTAVSNDIYSDSIYSRKKDYDDPFRQMTYGDADEMTAVLGSINDNVFLRDLKVQTAQFNERLLELL
ncbi:MAG: DUF4954 family protein, partial [Treponema sp.]|nr:DUF4954 family protein [Treponema sp.]